MLKTQFQSQVNSKLLIYLGCNVTIPLEDMGRVPQHIRGSTAGFWMRRNASEKLPVSLGLISKTETVCRWRDRFRSTGQVKDHPSAERPMG